MSGRVRVVITGMGVVAPNGVGLQAFSEALQNGRSGIRFIEPLKAAKFGCQVGGIPVIAESDFASCAKASDRPLGSEEVFGLLALRECLESSRLAECGRGRRDADLGLILGVGAGGPVVPEIFDSTDAGKHRRLPSWLLDQVTASAPLALLASVPGVGNECRLTSSACSSGTDAIIDGVRLLRSGRAKRVFAGSIMPACAELAPVIWGGFEAMRVLARGYNDDPARASRPMSESACGFVPAGGAGMLLLESLESARARGARIFAEILGVHMNSGGQRGGGSMTAPNPEGVVRCIQGALQDAERVAGVSVKEIDWINGHLTATFADPLELRSWEKIFAEGPLPWITSTKSMIGHLLVAAGSVETIASVLGLTEGFVHPSVNCEDLHPEILASTFCDRIPRETVRGDFKTVIKASFGFGDVNSVLVLRRWEEK